MNTPDLMPAAAQPGPTSAPARGAFGAYGGRYSGELLEAPLEQLARAVDTVLPSERFRSVLRQELEQYAGRPTPLTDVPRFSERCGLRVLLKREDLLHGGAHKTNNVIGQALLARELGKTRLVAETGAGQHGVATAMAAARYGLEAVVYMGARDAERQRVNVERMELFGARVIRVEHGAATLRAAIDEALRDWTRRPDDTHYLLGTVCGPDPFPRLVGTLQRVIGDEARRDVMERLGRLPEAACACVGGGSNAIGLFQGFLDDDVALFGVEPGGTGTAAGEHGAALGAGRPGILHGARTYVLQDADGQIEEAASVAAGLDYPGVGPAHAALADSGRARYVRASDDEALEAFQLLSRTEGILPALESSHALAFALNAVKRGDLERDAALLVNLSGRGDKDAPRFGELLGGPA